MYIPFNFTSGGWNKGFIPKLSYTVTNDIFNTGVVLVERPQVGNHMSFARYQEGKMMVMQQASASIRGYTMMSTDSLLAERRVLAQFLLQHCSELEALCSRETRYITICIGISHRREYLVCIKS